MKYILGILVILLGVAGIFQLSKQNKAGEGALSMSSRRAPNEFERAYVNLAPDTKSPFLCEKISPVALETNGFNPSGMRSVLTRSRCFYEVAKAMSDSSYCDKIIINRGGEYYSKNHCQEEVSAHTAPNTSNFNYNLIIDQVGLKSEVEKQYNDKIRKLNEGLMGASSDRYRQECQLEFDLCQKDNENVCARIKIQHPEDDQSRCIKNGYELCQRLNKTCLSGNPTTLAIEYFDYYLSNKGNPNFAEQLRKLPDFSSQ